VIPDKPEAITLPAESSARIASEPSAPRLKVLPSIQWEHKRDGSIEAWHAPEGARKRAEKTYLGRIGKRRLAGWLAEPSDKLPAIVAEWIATKRAEKGIG
jgi:hypothetical protein